MIYFWNWIQNKRKLGFAMGSIVMLAFSFQKITRWCPTTDCPDGPSPNEIFRILSHAIPNTRIAAVDWARTTLRGELPWGHEISLNLLT